MHPASRERAPCPHALCGAEARAASAGVPAACVMVWAHPRRYYMVWNPEIPHPTSPGSRIRGFWKFFSDSVGILHPPTPATKSWPQILRVLTKAFPNMFMQKNPLNRGQNNMKFLCILGLLHKEQCIGLGRLVVFVCGLPQNLIPSCCSLQKCKRCCTRRIMRSRAFLQLFDIFRSCCCPQVSQNLVFATYIFFGRQVFAISRL